MKPEERFYAIIGTAIAALSCIAAYLAIPQLQPGLEPTVAPLVLPTRPVVVAPRPAPTMPPEYVELSPNGSCQGFDVCGSFSPIHTYSHFPPIGKIFYTKVGVDDDLRQVELICPSSRTDITYLFEKIGTDGPFPRYQSRTDIELTANCRIDFILVNTEGMSGMSLSFRMEP